MKVRDLLKLLEGCDPEASISFTISEGCCGDYRDLELEDEDVEYATFPDDCHHINFRFCKIPGYYSCIQTGNTIKSHNEYWKNKPDYQVKR